MSGGTHLSENKELFGNAIKLVLRILKKAAR